MKTLKIIHTKNVDGFTVTQGDDAFLADWLKRQIASNAFGKPGEYQVIGPTEIVQTMPQMISKDLNIYSDLRNQAIDEYLFEGDSTKLNQYKQLRAEYIKKYTQPVAVPQV